MEIQELISFTTIVNKVVFQKHSKKLDYCQGSITVHIKNLERELGVHCLIVYVKRLLLQIMVKHFISTV